LSKIKPNRANNFTRKKEGNMASRTEYFWRHLPGLALALSSVSAHALTPSQVFEAVKDSVVVVKALDFMGKQTSQGSGVLLPDGSVATNCHVIENGLSYQVGRGKQFVAATMYAGDSDKDICLLKAKGIGGKPVRIGYAARLKVGEPVYAVGAPQGLELSLSDGIVSQLRGSSPPIVQTTAAISPGSSGGGLFDSRAQLVGFTTLYIDGSQSLNFAMPVEWLAGIQPGGKISSKQLSQIDWITRAAALEEKQDWSRLLDWGRKWIKVEPDNSLAWFTIGSAHQSLGQLDQAVAAYRQTLLISPKYVAPWNNLGIVYADLQRHDDAIAAYRQALRLNPEETEGWYNLGITYATINRHDDAITAWRQALRISPEHADAWYALGLAYAKLKRYNDAIPAYRQALRINPEYVLAWNNLGSTYYDLERYGDAITAFRQSLRINPEDANAWYLLGFCYVLSGNTSAALQATKTLRTLDPDKAETLFNLIAPR
jgi:cytochrome c-type biogenesis protein CcmH/NrfG